MSYFSPKNFGEVSVCMFLGSRIISSSALWVEISSFV